MRRLTTAISAIAFTAYNAAAAHDPMPTELPVGDGKIATSPMAGNVFSCRTNFRTGGARHTGEWFKGDTWNPLEKPHVRGAVMWPQASFTMTDLASKTRVESNGLPLNQPTGEFPIAGDDPAYQYDTNPNPILAQELDFNIPKKPKLAAEPGCLGMGMVGFTMTGVAFYSALDDAGRDAAAHEVQDLCDGHPQGKGQYHYHATSPCLPGADENEVVGWALDGFPIMGMREANGSLIKNDDLDACHGRVEEVEFDGKSYKYAYRLTAEYPYIIGCYSGLVAAETMQSIRASMGPPRRRHQRGSRVPSRKNGRQSQLRSSD